MFFTITSFSGSPNMATIPNALKPKNEMTGSNPNLESASPESPISQFGGKAREAASAAADKAKNLASSVAQSAEAAASTLGQKVEDAAAAVGSGMTSLAGTIHSKGPHEGLPGRASASVADTLESGGHYLTERGLKGMGDDLTDIIRRNPLPALLAGIGIGYLIARATSRNS
jgi:hypothetical protein